MNIAHVIFSLHTGGTETMLVDIINRQIKAHPVTLFIINDEINAGLLKSIDRRISIHQLNRVAGSKNPLPLVRLNNLLLRMAPDIIHCHDHKVGRLLLPTLRKKAVLTLHRMHIPAHNLGKYNRLFAISQAVRSDVATRAGIEPTLVYNGINTNEIKANGHRREDLPFRLLQIGRLDHKVKGQHLLLNAMQLLQEQGHSSFVLDLIGDGDSLEYLQQVTAEYKLTQRVRFLGQKDRSYIYDHLAEYDLLIQPSIVEGFGLTIAEAMAAAVPVLVSQLDGPMEIIDQGRLGDYFESGNAGALAAKLRELTSRDTLSSRERVGQALEYVATHFDINQTVASYLKEYELV